MSGALWRPYVFRVRARLDTYNQVSRMKSALVSCAPLNFVTEGNLLLKEIAKYDLPKADEPAAETAVETAA